MVVIYINAKPGVDPQALYVKIKEEIKGEPESKLEWDEKCKVDGSRISTQFKIAVAADFDEEVMDIIEMMEDEVASSGITFQTALE